MTEQKFICIRKMGGGEHEGSTVYYYYEPVGPYQVTDESRKKALAGLDWLTKELDMQWECCDLTEADCAKYERSVKDIESAIQSSAQIYLETKCGECGHELTEVVDTGSCHAPTVAENATVADQDVRKQLEPEEKEHERTLHERDRYHDMADKLAGAIANYFGTDVGEHSNMNCPWENALEIIDDNSQHHTATVPPVSQTADVSEDERAFDIFKKNAHHTPREMDVGIRGGYEILLEEHEYDIIVSALTRAKPSDSVLPVSKNTAEWTMMEFKNCCSHWQNTTNGRIAYDTIITLLEHYAKETT